MKNELITVNPISVVSIQFKNQVLNKATQKIMTIYTDAAKYAETKNREIAKILGNIAEQKAYLDDGFNSVAEYAHETFGIQTNNAYKLANAGKVYNSTSAPAQLKELPPSKLAEIASLPEETVKEGIENGSISKEKTQKELREFAASKKEKKKSEAKVRKYIARACSKDAAIVAMLLKDGHPATISEWDEKIMKYVKYEGGAEWAKLPAIKLDSSVILRKVYFSRSNSVVIEFAEWDPKKVGEKMTPAEILTISEEKKSEENPDNG